MKTLFPHSRAEGRIRIAAVLAAALAALMLLSRVQAGLEATATVQVQDAWARPTPPAAKVAAVYATLHNTADRPLSVTVVGSEVSDAAELHEMQTRDGVMRMRHLKDGLRLEPGQSAALEPGGTHVMLFGLRQPLREGERVLLHFKVSDGREIPVYAQVRESET